MVSDQPPADWYTDPEDESQYRYWDGSGWTEHRAPRHAEPDRDSGAASQALRGPGRLIGDSIALVRRQWRGFALAALAGAAGLVAAAIALFLTVDRILMGELGEIWDRISEPGFDPTLPEHEAYFESLDVDLSPTNFLPAAATLVVLWLLGSLVTAAIVRLALGDLRGRAQSPSEVLRRALERTPRLIGVQLQILAIGVAASAIAVVPAFASPFLLILTIPALLAAVFLSIPVLYLASVVASAGPSEPSLRCAFRLVRGRFWATLGRLLLISVILSAIGYGAGIVFAVVSGVASQLWWNMAQLGNGVVGSVLGLLGTAAAVIVYHDLGGESD